MNKFETKIYYIYILMCFSFILLTTKYIDLYDIIHVANQMDVISYIEIVKNAPLLPKNSDVIIQNVSQRFLIPYLAGYLAYILEIDFFVIFKIFIFIFIFFYILLINLLIKNLKLNFKESILFFSLLFLNPYVVRNCIFQPIMAHDMLFFCLGLIFAITIINKDYIINLATTVFSIYLRQTSIALFVSSCIFLLLNKKTKTFIALLLTYSVSFILIIKIGKFISTDKFPIHLAYGIIFYDFSQIEKLIKFLLLPMVSFFPLLIFFLSKIKNDINILSAIIMLFACIMMIGQPIMAGPNGSINNVGRIASLCYPLLTVFFFYTFDLKKIIKSNYLFYFFITGLFAWSLHPTFSVFKIFEDLRFYNY
jgi:hypothetical protein